jgi:hypothetical protein
VPARAAAASATAIIAARAAITSVGSTISSTAAGFAAGTEIAELTGEFGVERVVEADGNRTITDGHGITRSDGCRRRR